MRWEYRTIAIECAGRMQGDPLIDPAHERRLNGFGAEGWEVVAAMPIVDPDSRLDALVYVMKRPVDEQSGAMARLKGRG